MEFTDWRFNIRSSNTEPLVRLNVESRVDVGLMEEKTKEILELLKNQAGCPLDFTNRNIEKEWHIKFVSWV